MSPFANLKAYIERDGYFYFVVVFGVVVGPGAAVCADHVPSMSEGAEIEHVRFGDHDVLVAHAYGNPVRIALLDLEMEALIIRTFFQVRFHERKFIPRSILRFHMIIGDKLDIVMFQSRRELELRRNLPDIGLINRLLQSLLIFLQHLINFLHITRDHEINLLVTGVEGVDQLLLRDVCGVLGLFAVLAWAWDHCYEFFYPVFQAVYLR